MTLPLHLNALRALDATARHGSFTGAATELNVTAAAVGQMVRGLEDWLGKPLFHRMPSGRNRLVPTEAAELALPDIRAGLGRLGIGLDRLRAVDSQTLTVAVSPAFAAKWLLPRIDGFQAEHPQIDIRLDTNLKPVDYIAHGIDIGIRYGEGRWPGLTAEKLMDEDVFPVCSPSFAGREAVLTLADLSRQPLLHDLSVAQHPAFLTWARWLRAAGVPEGPIHRGLQINNSAAVLQAAVDGQGIALARSILAQDDLAAGRLVRLLPEMNVPSLLAYYIVLRPDHAHLARCTAFRSWLLRSAQ